VATAVYLLTAWPASSKRRGALEFFFPRTCKSSCHEIREKLLLQRDYSNLPSPAGLPVKPKPLMKLYSLCRLCSSRNPAALGIGNKLSLILGQCNLKKELFNTPCASSRGHALDDSFDMALTCIFFSNISTKWHRKLVGLFDS
jgi:hypothetical protein